MTRFCASDYSDYDLSNNEDIDFVSSSMNLDYSDNECSDEEELPEPLIDTVNETPSVKPVEERKQITKDDVIKELVRIYSNNAFITGNGKWIGDCKNDTELANQLSAEIDRLINEKTIKDDNCILNFEHIPFFIDDYIDHTINDKYSLFYSYYGICDDYVATNHLNIELNKEYQLIPDVKE